MSRKIRVLIGPKGQVKIEPIGFTGTDCLQATMGLEQALGTVKNREITDAMYTAEVSEDADQTA